MSGGHLGRAGGVVSFMGRESQRSRVEPSTVTQDASKAGEGSNWREGFELVLVHAKKSRPSISRSIILKSIGPSPSTRRGGRGAAASPASLTAAAASSMSLQATPAAAGKPSALLRERDPNQLASVQKSAGKRKMVCFEIEVGAAWHHRPDEVAATSARAGRAEYRPTRAVLTPIRPPCLLRCPPN